MGHVHVRNDVIKIYLIRCRHILMITIEQYNNEGIIIVAVCVGNINM